MNLFRNIKWKEGKSLYLLLWIGASVFAIVMVSFTDSKNTELKIFKSQPVEKNTTASEMINELLLSADQLNIAEKNSFISLYLKPAEVEIQNAITENNNEKVYDQIFQRKIKNIKKQKNKEDFSIKPTPK